MQGYLIKVPVYQCLNQCGRSLPAAARAPYTRSLEAALYPPTCPNGDLMQLMSLKNIAFTFLFRSPDQETCTGCFTHP